MLLLNSTHYRVPLCPTVSRLTHPSVLRVLTPSVITPTHGPWTDVTLSHVVPMVTRVSRIVAVIIRELIGRTDNPFRHCYTHGLRRDTIPMREEYLKMNTFLPENSDQKLFRRNSFFNKRASQDAENKLVVWLLLAGMSFLLYGILYTI